MIRVVIADDSAFMRKVISDLLTKTPDFQDHFPGSADHHSETANVPVIHPKTFPCTDLFPFLFPLI